MRVAKFIYLTVLFQFLIDVIFYKQKFEDEQWIAWVVLLVCYVLKWYDKHGGFKEGGEREPLLYGYEKA